MSNGTKELLLYLCLVSLAASTNGGHRADGRNGGIVTTTRAYPLTARCEDCGASPTRWVAFWVNGMRYRVCKAHAREYRRVTLRGINPRTGEPS